MGILYTQEITQAVVDKLKGASLSFNPLVVQRGDIAFIPEPSLVSILPAVFVKVEGVEINPAEETTIGNLIYTKTYLRIVTAREYSEGDQVWDLKVSTIDDIVEVFFGSGYPNLGNPITGYTIFNVWPTTTEVNPPEDEMVSLYNSRRLYAIAVNLEVYGRAERS